MAESFSLDCWGSTSEDILKTQFPMHRACRDGDVETLAILLSEGQRSVYEEDSFYGWTPAHWAAYFGKLGCLRKLMTGVEVNCSVQTSRFKQTPAHLAAFGGHPQCLLWLVQSGVQVELQDYLGETAIHKAARTGSMECVSLLAAHGANLIVVNNNGHSPSQVAVMCGHSACNQFLEEYTMKQRAQGIAKFPTNGFHTGPTHPAQHDVTAGSVIPCIPTPTNGHSLLTNGHTNGFSNGFCEDSEMECSENVAPTDNTMKSATDITLDHRVSQNIVAVGGRKRSREEVHEVNYKRPRINGVSVENGMGNHFAPNFVNSVNSVCMSGDGSETKFSNGVATNTEDEYVAYDYNGIMEEDYERAASFAETCHAASAQKPARCAAFNLMGHYI